MSEKINYISDEELELLISQVEQEELVAAPPDLMESILLAAGLAKEHAVAEENSLTAQKVVAVKKAVTRKKEFYAYCFRVVASVAAAVALVFLLPELTERMTVNGMPVVEHVEKSEVVGTIPVQAEVVKNAPDRATVVGAKPTPTKEEVLNDTGFIEKVISSTAEWLSKESKEQ